MEDAVLTEALAGNPYALLIGMGIGAVVLLDRLGHWYLRLQEKKKAPAEDPVLTEQKVQTALLRHMADTLDDIPALTLTEAEKTRDRVRQLSTQMANDHDRERESLNRHESKLDQLLVSPKMGG